MNQFAISAPRALLNLCICLLGLSAIDHVQARVVRAIFVMPPPDVSPTALLYSKDKAVEIELPSRNLSPEVTIPNGDLVLAVLPAAPAAGEAPPAGAPTVKIPASWTRCILLFLPDPDNPVFPARVLPINSSGASFPNGQTLIYNASGAALLGKFGDEKVAIRPGKKGVVKSPRADFGPYPVEIDCILKGDKKLTPICRTNWQHDPAARQILFVTPPGPGHKVPRVWGVLDRERKDEE